MQKTIEVVIKVDDNGAVEEIISSDPDIVFYTVNKDSELLYGPYGPDQFKLAPLEHIKTERVVTL